MRRIIIIAVCCVVVFLGGYAGYHWYKANKQEHLIGMAREFIAKSQDQQALLCLQLVMRSNPDNLEAIRMMASLAATANPPNALLLRKRVVELNPNSNDDKLSLAQTAIILSDFRTASNALKSVSMDGKKTAAFQNIAGTVAEASGRLAEAEAHFTEALRLQPANPNVQLDLAMVRLLGTNVIAKAGARSVLTRVADDPSDPSLRCMALRELLMDAVHSHNMDTALVLSKKLVQLTNSLFSDKLLRLDLLKKTGNPEYKAMLTDIQRSTTNEVKNIAALATWQFSNIPLDNTLAWLNSLPTNIKTNQPTTFFIAQCLMFKQDWPGLRTWIQKQNWVNTEFVRHAFLARALKELNLNATSETEWQQALDQANKQELSLWMLLQMTDQWKWESKGEDILWAMVNKYPGNQRANDTLVQILFESGRTRPLMTLYSQQLNWDPSNLTVKNNLAMCALLLNAQEQKPNDLARSLYEKDSDNPTYVSTYAFSLHLQKKDSEALKVIEKLKPEELKIPSVAGYYGLILKETGNPAKAKIYLDLAYNSNLLPEERKMFDQAKIGI